MADNVLHTDYLVIGSGAMGMAFTDTLLNESDASVIMVDKHHRPGGHWNDSYPFVHLHQPSAFYGVNSRQLGNDTIDSVGLNKGLYELASGGEVCAYFEQVMQQQFLPSGRLQYFPMCEYLQHELIAAGDKVEAEFVSTLSGERTRVTANKIVDATYMNVKVPSIHEPNYLVHPDIRCVPVNALPKEPTPAAGYVVIGAGKTAMDACLFLLDNGLPANKITWIKPRESWMLDRANIQPDSAFITAAVGGAAEQLKQFAEAKSLHEIIHQAEAGGQLIRLDPEIEPTMYRCATVTNAELEELRRLENVVRLGRVVDIQPTEIHLEHGVIPTSADHLHIDCTADGLATRDIKPVFAGPEITLQSVRTCQQVFSAAFTARIECNHSTDEEKNDFCKPVPHPDTATDFVRTALQNFVNSAKWGQDPHLTQWLQRSRLDGFTHTPKPGETRPARPAKAENQPRPEQARAAFEAAVANLTRLLESVS